MFWHNFNLLGPGFIRTTTTTTITENNATQQPKKCAQKINCKSCLKTFKHKYLKENNSDDIYLIQLKF